MSTARDGTGVLLTSEQRCGARRVPLVLPSMVLSMVLGLALGLAGCSEQITETQRPIGGTCLACHDGISEIHPKFALACVDCHGGNDQVALPAVVNVRDQELLRASHGV